MAVLNDLDRFHLAVAVIDRVPKLGERASGVRQEIQGKLLAHKAYIHQHGEDMPEIRDWKWGAVENLMSAHHQLRLAPLRR